MKKVAAILTAMLLVCVNPLENVSEAYMREETTLQRIETQKFVTEKIVVKEVIKEIDVMTSAYYAATPSQGGEYATGSYEGDLKLNGNGKVTKYKKKKPKRGKTIATDPTVFPPGTKLRLYDPELPEEKRVYYDFEAEDGGEAITGKKIDIYMGRGRNALRKALKWGKKRMVAQVIEKKTEVVTILAQR